MGGDLRKYSVGGGVVKVKGGDRVEGASSGLEGGI